MFKFTIYLFVCFVTCTSVDVGTVNKRSDIDLQTCIENFDIHKDKIIRTQDSRNMGAKYLNEIDLGSREECLRLCCETDTCDVFVYEEKSPGSCYLFHCGPPEDFKCKFTRHVNYSSAVLTVNRHLNELENQIKLTKHEQELTRLRKPDDARPQDTISRTEVTRMPSTISPMITTQKTKIAKEILPAIAATKAPPIIGRHCSRYQFECRTSGECIAIYNACDGIPQCADGSDEAPELGCPALVTTAAPSLPPRPLQQPAHTNNNAYEQTNQVRKALPPMLADNAYRQQSVVNTNQRIPMSIEGPRDPTAFLRPVPDIRDQTAALPALYNDQPLAQVQPQQPFMPARPSSANNWMPHQSNQMPVLPPNSQYGDKNSHIFNHKESGLQVVESPDRYKYKGAMQTLHRALAMGQYVDTTRGGGTGAQFGDMNTRNDYQKIPNYYGDAYRPQYPVPDNWQPNRVPANGEGSPFLTNDNWQPVQIPQTQTANEQTNQLYRQNADAKPNWKTDLINTEAEAKDYDHTIIREPKPDAEKVVHTEIVHEQKKADEHVEDTTKKIHSENSVHKKSHAHSATAEELKQNVENLLDGAAERPGGAVLSLTLGVCLTCMMAILIGCRLRVVRRRMRRGGKSPYAHDADYLVNGMYL